MPGSDVVQPPTPAEYLAVARLREALRRFSAESERITRAHGLTTQRYQLLLMIKAAREGSGRATQKELAARLSLAQSSLTELVHRAEDLRLIRRRLVAARRGEVAFELTASGERRLRGAMVDLRGERSRLLSLLSSLE